ncbi:MAG: DUF4097 family beta strand repeat-containing protein [Thermoactinomyces sp.]
MINIKKISIFALILLLIGGIGSLLTFSSFKKATAVAEEKSLGNNFSAVQINAKNIGVRIVPAKEKTAKVRLHGHEADTTHSFSAEVKGSVLSVEAEKRQQSWINIAPKVLILTVYLPEKQYETIHVNSGNGFIQAENVDVKNIKTQTANGWIKLNSITATDVNANTTNGQITLNDVKGKISGKTRNGQITMATERLDLPVQLTTDAGRILIQTEQEPTNVTFDVHTNAGKIDILDQYNGSTTIGKGENLIKLTTDRGMIKVE